MDLLGWLWVILKTVIGLAWSLVWLLVGGWVSTLLQVLILVGIVFSYKYGWQRAPVEMVTRGRALARFVWGWARAREMAEPPPPRTAAPRRASRRSQEVRAVGDINVSTLLSVLAICGLGLIAAT